MNERRILVIEDEYLVGLDVVSALEDAGYSNIEHASTEAEALKHIESSRWDAVVADANLNGKSIDGVATLLRDKQTPFVIVTGYRRDHLPAVIGSAPILGKPFSPGRLARTVDELCSGTSPNPKIEDFLDPYRLGTSPPTGG